MTIPADSEMTSRYKTDPQEPWTDPDWHDEFRKTVEQEMADRAEAQLDRIEWEAGR